MNSQGCQLESIERLRVSDESSYSAAYGTQWEILNVAAPKLNNFLMVPVASSEIIFLGGTRANLRIGEVSVLSLTDLTMKVLCYDPDYKFLSWSNNYNVSKSGTIHAVVERAPLDYDAISFSKASNKI